MGTQRFLGDVEIAGTLTAKLAGLQLGSSKVAFYSKILAGGLVSWDVAGDGFASVAGCAATAKAAALNPQVVDDASDPVSLLGITGAAGDDYNLALIDPGVGVAFFFPASMTKADIVAMLGISSGDVKFYSGDAGSTTSPGPVLIAAGTGTNYTWDNTPLDDSSVGSITTSPGNPTLNWSGSAFAATYAEWTLGGTTFENTIGDGPPVVDSYFLLAAGIGPARPLAWTATGTVVTVGTGDPSTSNEISVIVWGTAS